MKFYTDLERENRQKFYHKSAWRRIRKIQLRRKPLCEACEAEGKITVATVCDHKSPLWQTWEEFIAGPFSSYCRKHHDEKTLEVDYPMIKKKQRLKLEVWE